VRSGLEESEPWAVAVDPCFSSKDRELLGTLGILSSDNPDFFDFINLGSALHGAGASRPFLFFMPHCPGVLYSSVLTRFSWVSPSYKKVEEVDTEVVASTLPLLPTLCLIGNSFKAYTERRRSSREGEGAYNGGESLFAATTTSTSAEDVEALRLATQRLCDEICRGEGGSEERLPPLSLDAVVALVSRTARGGGALDINEGCDLFVKETPLEAYVTENRREVIGTSPAYQQALSTTSVHSFQFNHAD